jgi:uncharacterized protein YegJ (DUF2314 family)
VIPAGDLTDEHIAYEFAVYYLPEPSTDPLVELDALLKGKYFVFHRAEKVEGQEDALTLAARIETHPAANYAPPELDSLQYFGRGLSRDQAEALQETRSVLVLDFAYSAEHRWNGLRSALELTDSLARSTGGVIWDEETREMFSPDVWKERRLDAWTEDIPDISDHTVIHAYQAEEYVRAITLGMAKFGLPDLVVEDFSWSLNRNMGHVINLFAQSLAEGSAVPRPSEFDLDIRAIRNAKVREPQLQTLKDNATGVALLSLRAGTWEEGDPRNRLVEITFDRGVGPNAHAKQEDILGTMFGWEDETTAVQHDEELQAASERARQRLPALQAEFNDGLAPGEFILVKAPFETPDGGREWMWVEVISWNGDKIEGLLKNEPFNIPDLHGGQMVEVTAAEVFDYIRKHTDGTTEGNETGAILENRSP